MRRVSKKRAVAARLYSRQRLLFLGANPTCARCGVAATEIHHMQGRIGGLLLDESRWLGLCHDCHAWVTVHPREAVEAGWSLPRVGVA